MIAGGGKKSLKTTSKTFSKREGRSAESKRAKYGKGGGRLLDSSLNRLYFQICICLCTGGDFYCRQVLSTGSRGNDVNRIQLDTATAALWELFQQRFIQDVLCTDFLLHQNICRALLSINTLTIEDTLILFQELNVMTIAGKFLQRLMLNLTVSLWLFHTWLVIFTPVFDICVSSCCLLPWACFHCLNLRVSVASFWSAHATVV